MEKNYIISIQELLKGRGRNTDFDLADEKRIKLVRHSGDVNENSLIYDRYKESVYKLYRSNYKLFLEWQSEQEDSKMKNVEYLVVFIAEERCKSRFIGVFKNYGPTNPTKDGLSVYDIREVKGFEVLKDIVIIDWGKGALQWMQNWATLKEVKRIEQEAYDNDVPFFTRYEDVVLSYQQLCKVVKDKDWQLRFESLNCVYLILNKENGKQYVGVTYKDVKSGRKNGILGRWTEYAEKVHGDNKMLVDLLAKEGIDYGKQNFQWTILETLPLNVTPKVAIDRESDYKKKLGTRDNGYNDN